MPKKKIVIVDDELDYLDMFRTRLEANGYDVVCASGGQQGLELILRERPDLVLLDIVLPDIDGLKICSSLKSNPATKDIKVIVCTNKLADVSAEKAVESCADEFIEKMADSKILLKAVSSLI